MAERLKLDIYHTFQSLEWATSYYYYSSAVPSESVIDSLAEAEAYLFSENVEIRRWEAFHANGTKWDEDSLSIAVPGVRTGNMANIHYALLLRETAPANKRPSVKYIHGYTVDAFTSLGELSTTYLGYINDFGDVLNSLDFRDSDTQLIEGLVFRGFSRRTKMRQISQ